VKQKSKPDFFTDPFAEPMKKTYHVDPAQFIASGFYVALLLGKVPFNRKSVAIALLLSQFEFKLTWEK
jgi:hypothetical protein